MDINQHNFFSEEYFVVFLTFVKQNRHFYREFVNNQQHYPIDKGFDTLWHEIMVPYYKSLKIENEQEMMYHFTFIQAGFTMVLKRWLNQDCQEPLNKIAEILHMNTQFVKK